MPSRTCLRTPVPPACGNRARLPRQAHRSWDHCNRDCHSRRRQMMNRWPFAARRRRTRHLCCAATSACCWILTGGSRSGNSTRPRPPLEACCLPAPRRGRHTSAKRSGWQLPDRRPNCSSPRAACACPDRARLQTAPGRSNSGAAKSLHAPEGEGAGGGRRSRPERLAAHHENPQMRGAHRRSGGRQSRPHKLPSVRGSAANRTPKRIAPGLPSMAPCQPLDDKANGLLCVFIRYPLLLCRNTITFIFF
jgi:hypothetical protein